MDERQNMIGAVCIKTQCEQRELSFAEILLDETLVQGDIWILKEALCDVGGINYRLGAKRYYELLIRIAKKYRVLQCGQGSAPETSENAEGTMLQQEKMLWEEEGAGKDWIHFGQEASEEADEETEQKLKTDCYLIGRYKTELLALGCFDEAVLGIASSGGEKVLQYLEKMVAGAGNFYDIYDCTQPILIYAGDNVCYNILDFFARSIGSALEQCGQCVEYFDVSEKDIEELQEYAKRRFKAVIGMQTYMFSVKWGSGRFVHDDIEAPKYQFVFDHPIKLKDHLRNVPGRLCVLTPDGNYAEFIRKYYGNPARFLPPAGQGLPDENRSKEYDVIFLGTYYEGPLKDLQAVRNMDRKRCYLLNRYILRMRKNLHMTPEQALTETLDYYGNTYTKEDFIEILYRERWVIHCLSYHYRNKVIELLLRSGIQVHVFGDTWQKSPMHQHPGLICHKAALGEEALEVYARAKVSLNIMTWHKDGFTERIANAMLQKAVVVTDRTDYLEQNFVNDKELLMFDLGHIQELPDRIKALLADEEKRKKIAENGFQKALQQHTWDRRARRILEWIEEDRA